MCEKLNLKQAEEFDRLTFKVINNPPLQQSDKERYNDLLSIKQEWESSSFKKIH